MKLESNILIFPGQGSQKIGMGKELATQFAVARDVFATVDEALSFNLSALMFDGDATELNKTSNAQPAIMAVSMAYWEVIKSLGLIDKDTVKFVAGHSLGEYSALCAAGILSLEDTARLLKARGAYMMQACEANPGAMAAVIGLGYDAVQMIADDAGCFVGNSNSPAQIVLSGSNDTVAKACDLAKERGAKRAIMLPVSGAFHSPLMQSAADKMAEVIAKARFAEPAIPVVSNLTARPYTSVDEIKSLLVEQITHTVKWQESVAYMAQAEGCRFIETGFGNILTGLVKKILPDAVTITMDELLTSAQNPEL
jgi:[acyl-carrier-protein] S-malonyltransferase